MPSTILLSSETAPLRTLTLARLQLDQEQPVCTVTTQGEELLLYVLIGQIILRDQLTQEAGSTWGPLGSRRAVTEPGVAVMRFPAGQPRAFDVHLCDFSADVLLVSAPGPVSAVEPCSHRHDIFAHQVGTGTHQREVREVSTPAGYTISCGETLNIPGGVSSWPPHANAEDLATFQAGITTWEECFFCVCPSRGIAVLDGVYADGIPVQEMIWLENGKAYCMPLGSHMCYAAPDSYLYYAWFYHGNALKKQYKKYADDVLTYRK